LYQEKSGNPEVDSGIAAHDEKNIPIFCYIHLPLLCDTNAGDLGSIEAPSLHLDHLVDGKSCEMQQSGNVEEGRSSSRSPEIRVLDSGNIKLRAKRTGSLILNIHTYNIYNNTIIFQ
jgi:hypothetical protein